MTLASSLAAVPRLWSFAYSADGTTLARLARRDDDGVTVELRDFRRGGPAVTVLGPDPALPVRSHVSVQPGGTRVFVWHRLAAGGFRVLDAGPGRSGTVTECDVAGLRLLPWPPAGGWQPMVTLDHDGVSTLWRIEPNPTRLTRLVQLPGVTAGGVWLDAGHRLAIDVEDGAGASGYLVDLRAGNCRRLVHVSDDSRDGVALFDRARNRLVMTSDVYGYPRLAVADLAGDRKASFLPDPPGAEPSVEAGCLTDDGHLVVRRQRGVRSELWRIDLENPTWTEPVSLPAGFVGPPVAPAGAGVRFPFSSPLVPAASASWTPVDGFRLDEQPDLGPVDLGRLRAPRVATVSSLHGPVEALVYEPAGPPRPVTVVALHGGPVAQWSMDFAPELHAMAGTGATVIAPNVSGSTGYGPGFVRRLEGRAGVVDLEDVLAVVSAARAEHPARAIVLYGESYGGFLAFLLAASRPDLCDGVLALAPAAAMAALATAGPERVGTLIRALGGAATGAQPGWLTRSVRCPVLVAHGTDDDAVPVEHSRALRDELRDIELVELAGEGHTITTSSGLARWYRHIEQFLTRIESAHAGRRARAGRQPTDCAEVPASTDATPRREEVTAT